MKDKIVIFLFLLISFVLTFVITTVLTDAWCHANGYYQEGIQSEQGLYQ